MKLATLAPKLSALTLAAALLALSACGTIVHGTNQQFAVSSDPSGATVEIDDIDMGETPLTTEISRKDKHTLRIMLDGYETEEMIVNRSVSGWAFGNIIFGGLIGLGVDAVSGGMYKLSPEEVNAQLDEQMVGNMRAPDGDGVFITLVESVDPSWERIGTLTRAND